MLSCWVRDSGVGTNFGVGTGEARPEEPIEGTRAGGVLGRGQPAPSHQLRGLGEHCKLSSGVRGGARAAEGFLPA